MRPRQNRTRDSGSPHHGPDVLENMLCLCPNHHEQFDKFGYYIDPETFEVKQLKGFEGKKIKIVFSVQG